MGNIKYKDELVYQGPIAKISTSSGWNNSMCEYYPYITVTYIENRIDIKSTIVNLTRINDPRDLIHLKIQVDEDQEEDMNSILRKEEMKREAEEISMHKLVRVVKGRKVPKGTEGEVFWIGFTKFGRSVGIRLLDGTKVFTSFENVKAVSLDDIFEKEILG
jgi:hypothetical protein